MNNREMSEEIISRIGGNANIVQAWHCITRLRFNVKDEKQVQVAEITKLPGVLGAQFQNDQFQVVIGNNVASVYTEVENVMKETASSESSGADRSGSGARGLNAVLDTISGIFTPILPAIVGAGMLKGVLALLVSLGWISQSSGEYSVFTMISNASFYFLPFLLAVSAARKFKVNEYLALTLAGTLLYPTILDAYTAGKLEAIPFLGLPVSIVNYTQSVIPIILGVWLLSYVYRLIDRFIPNTLKIIFTPMLVLAITVPIMLIAIGPLGNFGGIYLEKGVSWLFAHSGPLTGIVLGGLMPLIVMTGMHYAFFPGTLQNLSKLGYDVLLLPINLITNLSQAGAVLAVFLRTRDPKMKSVALSSGISALLGITEPALYGVSLKLKRPFYASIIGGAAGGGFITAVGLKCYGFAVPGLLSLPLYIEPGGGMRNFSYALIGIAISFVVSFVMTLILWKESDPAKPGRVKHKGKAGGEQSEATSAVPEAIQSVQDKKNEIFSPFHGELVPLRDLPDKTFANELTGKGIAVKPTEGRMNAPFDGVVTMVAKSKHAVMLRSNDGVEVLVHIGLNTVSLKGQHFEVKVVPEQKVQKGDLLVEFDLEAIEAKGLNIVSPVIVTNTPDYLDVVPVHVKGVIPMNGILLFTIK
ncbi:beta-glucoside-specific PTS transporter subunit IIABC [Paenibacillus sp. FSL R7-0333]|uniref:beta-glucoside-specific PTS transporter subunit IIABC n=1 Tax=Paenibacillus sp. FSL R7-0333 TaxID=1926587 RepID=UPI00096CC679|nr:PTS beta-glucoside transporter subunit EIIBCA [Paenibacillus sp. FSL R7-0333]